MVDLLVCMFTERRLSIRLTDVVSTQDEPSLTSGPTAERATIAIERNF